jgi:general secretion pathway protein K
LTQENRQTIPHLQTECDRSRTERGNALLVVIGVIGVLAAIAVAYQAATQSQSRTFDALSTKISGEAAADAAVRLGEWRVAVRWRRNPVSVMSAEFYCEQDGALTYVAIEDESLKLNLNLASATAIANELTKAGVGPEKASGVAARIADYVDRDDQTGAGRSEAADFAAAGALSSPKNAPLEIIDEALLLPGVDAATFDIIDRTLSLYSTRTDRLKNLAAAPDEVAPARGVYRIKAIVEGANGAAYDRTAIIELDPAAPLSPTVRVWRRSRQPSTLAQPGIAGARSCKEILLNN